MKFNFKKLRQCTVMLGALIVACHVSAANILVLTTAEGPADGIAINNNCLSEFIALRPTHTVVTLAGKLNDNTSPLTAQDLSPISGPYDIVVTCTVYASANQQAIDVISSGMQHRTARAFFNFDERGSFMPAFIATKNDWTLALGSIRGGSGESQILNARSIYAGAFSGFPVMGGHSYGTYTGVSINNALYTPQSAPIPPNSDTVPGASTIVVPIEQSYLDGNGEPLGACLFQSTDVSMFDSVRYSGNRGKIAASFIRASEPGEACSLSPSISKAFSSSSVVAGGTSILTISIKNNSGYTDASGVFQPGAPVSDLMVHDTFPAPLQLAEAPTTTCTGGTLTGNPGQSALALDGATLPSAGCTITAKVIWPVSGAALCTGINVINNIESGVDFKTLSGTSKQNATAPIACAATASIQVSKSVAETRVLAGGTANFTVSISNIGPVAGSGISVNDPMTSDWTGVAWSCSASGGATCPTTSGTGSISLSNLMLPADGTLNYNLASVAAGTSSSASNIVNVTAGDGQCSTGGSTCSASATVTVLGGVQISKTRMSGANANVGDSVQYAVQAANPSGVPMNQPIVVTDPLPAGFESGTWICTGACGINTSGAMPLSVTLDRLDPQTSVTFTIAAVVAASAQGTSIVNTATAVPSAPELCIDGQNQCSASADAVNISQISPSTPVSVPSLNEWVLILLSIALAGIGLFRIRSH